MVVGPEIGLLTSLWLSPPAFALGSAGLRSAQALRFEGVVRQADERSCGYAAAATVLRALGFEASEAEVARAAGAAPGGPASVADIGRAVRRWGVTSFPVLGDWEGLLRYFALHPEPVVALVDVGGPHFTVVTAVEEGAVYLADPSQGHRVWSRQRFLRRWTGVVLFLRPPPGAPTSDAVGREPGLEGAVRRLASRHRLLLRQQAQAAPLPAWRGPW